ncbi:MAG: FAD-binding protein [Pseudonocardia sp.]|uniref:D-arabinono-1,4-lactone oxidase n=1 Tax=unclassified Pseudonocardia TaxID=2619320 RepID=UPI00086D49FB|nr:MULTISPECIES: D-arabinono-1,4-lactone oxidase [unclassified Pseudonocardia]MBN9110661.1 FAD-binding protein [Pseudonocardia sp.]ODU18651.1 MAG: FAD-linked oxidoreductase [Pseudonocardia sp. SCN 72-51]ODV04378.1 MAG: FAD-linked oxidoreductase [Pseudonocardia sp. SCN 73-27]
MSWTNWAGTATASPAEVAEPTTVDELQRVVARAAASGLRVKALGSGHSFTPIAVTDGLALRLDRLRGIVSADASTGLATVLAGTTLHELGPALWDRGLAMPNLGDIDVQTVAGALATGTHGTGATLGGLSTQVAGMQLVLADGTLLDCAGDDVPAAAIGLGALGIVATVTLRCVPAFLLHAHETPAEFDEVLRDAGTFGAFAKAHDHAELYWFPHTRRLLTKRNDRTAEEPRPLPRRRRIIDDELLSNTVFGWSNRACAARPSLIPRVNAIATRALSARTFVDRSYRVFATPRRVRFRETEYALPRDAVPRAVAEIEDWLRRSGERVAFPIEVRVAAADDVWLSTAYGRDSGYVAVHQYVDVDHTRYFDAAESILRSLGGRPHWGKMHSLTAHDLAVLYPRFDDFRAVRDRLDPGRTFTNPYLRRVLGD